MSAHPIVVPATVIIGKVAPVNQVQPITLLTGTSGESACGPQKDWILDDLNLQGLENWPKAGQNMQGAADHMGTPVCPQ